MPQRCEPRLAALAPSRRQGRRHAPSNRGGESPPARAGQASHKRHPWVLHFLALVDWGKYRRARVLCGLANPTTAPICRGFETCWNPLRCDGSAFDRRRIN
jgi:hypothetical protein